METEVSMAWRRTINRSFLIAATLVGMLVVFSSVIVLDGHHARVLALSAGMAILIFGISYAASPFLTSERRYLPLRAEVRALIQLARSLNAAAVNGGSAEEIERIESDMHESVRRMVKLAGKRG